MSPDGTHRSSGDLSSGGEYLQLQRAALQEVLRLSQGSVQPQASHIERACLQDESRARQQYERESAALQAGFDARRAQAEQDHRDAIRRITERHEADLRTLQANIRAARGHVREEIDALTREATTVRDDELLMAETVATSTQGGLQQEFDGVRLNVESARGRPEQIQAHAEQLMHEYRRAVPDPPPAPTTDFDDPIETFARRCAAAEECLRILASLPSARLFIGGRFGVLLVLLAAVALGGTWGLYQLPLLAAVPPLLTAALLVTGCVGAAIAVGRTIKHRGHRRLDAVYQELQQAVADAQAALDQRLRQATAQLHDGIREAVARREEEVRGAHRQYEAAGVRIGERQAALDKIDQRSEGLHRDLERDHRQRLEQATARREWAEQELVREHQAQAAELDRRFEGLLTAGRQRYDAARGDLERGWTEGLAVVERLVHETRRHREHWGPGRHADSAATEFHSAVRFGTLGLDLSQLAGGVRRQAAFLDDGPAAMLLPALLAFPDHGSVILEAAADARAEATAALQSLMVQVLTTLPPGAAQFTIIDPVGLGENFAGFMHLSDFGESLIGPRVWTEPNHIERQLLELTQHIEMIIQKYLRNEFKTIEQYNRQAGKLAEPYRFVVIADFPASFSEEAVRRLGSIINNGPRCGIHCLIAAVRGQALPPGFDLAEMARGSVQLCHDGSDFVWQDEVFRHFPLKLDPPPSDAELTRVVREIGRRARESARVEVPFERIAPAPNQRWSRSSSNELQVAIGFAGANRFLNLHLGRGVAQHVLIAGKTGSGKSTLLHVMIINLALWYGPDQVEFYLVDFKEGVEFKAYAVHQLPHARVVAIESDREFGLSVLQRLDEELQRRGALFREAGVQDLSGYRQAGDAVLPRTLLMVDEFQILFSEDDKLAQDAAILLDRLVRQGRAFGIHVVLGSQTLGGSSRLARTTMGQMAVRIALQCTEADSQLILDDENVAARLLSRPGEAIYNDVGGRVEGNQPFQTAWLSEVARDGWLSQLGETRSRRREPLVVFEGNAPADISQNPALAAQRSEGAQAPPSAARLWLGDPVAIKEATAATLARQSGANLMIVGQQDETALALMMAATISLAAQFPPAGLKLVVLEGGTADVRHAGAWARLAGLLPHDTQRVGVADVAAAIAALAEVMRRRLDDSTADEPTVVLVVFGLQRYRVLRRRDDDFSFSADHGAGAPQPDRQFADLLRDGPAVGIHTLVWADTYATLERTLGRQALGEFDHRVLLQMSASDSSTLIDTPAANHLGYYRALLYSEAQGLLEKFRPYALPDADWLERFGRALSAGRGRAAG